MGFRLNGDANWPYVFERQKTRGWHAICLIESVFMVAGNVEIIVGYFG
jgi:hypothetical protein